MKKINCYSKIASIIYLILFIILLIVGILPFVLFEEQESSIFKVIWIIIFTFGILFSTFCFFYYRQYIYIKDDKIILKNKVQCYENETYEKVAIEFHFD